jgi:alkanesulfonate monooxygenase SsuD/methylene tetrahydromethanopterin reductase-like flavin-dependent oxidoreductase (luciferase family)
MKVGVIVPQGWTGEYHGLEPGEAWRRTVAAAQRAEALGFDSLWLFDHMHTVPRPGLGLTFEPFTALSALAAVTSRARLGHVVACAAYRNPALLAKMIATMDVVSGGRMECGLGAGWKREEWRAYGYDFPETRERLRHLEDTLRIVTAMLHDPAAGSPPGVSAEGETASIQGAINDPMPIQRHLPIMVGGNGRQVTWRLAARYADELNLDNMPADEWLEARGDLVRHCEAIGRDPDTVKVSVHIWWETLENARSRVDLLRSYTNAGMDRVITLVRAAADDLDALDRFATECRDAGVEMAEAAA